MLSPGTGLVLVEWIRFSVWEGLDLVDAYGSVTVMLTLIDSLSVSGAIWR